MDAAAALPTSTDNIDNLRDDSTKSTLFQSYLGFTPSSSIRIPTRSNELIEDLDGEVGLVEVGLELAPDDDHDRRKASEEAQVQVITPEEGAGFQIPPQDQEDSAILSAAVTANANAEITDKQ